MYKPTRLAREQLNVLLQHVCGDGDRIDFTVWHYNRTTIISGITCEQRRQIYVVRRFLKPHEEFERLEAFRAFLDASRA
jgi:hypothetical protein